jgi:hypothetical protein
MPIVTTSTAWTAATAAPVKRPIYVLQLAGLSTVYTTEDLARPFGDPTIAVTGTLPSYQPWLKTPQGAAQSVDVLNGTATVGNLTCEVINPDGSIRALIGGTTLAGKTMTLYVGYPATAWPADFVPLHTYVVAEALPSGDWTSGLITGYDPQQLLNISIGVNPDNDGLLSDTNPWVVQGTPSEVVQALVLFGAGLPPSLLNIAALQALDSAAENLYAVQRPFEFRITSSFTLLNFINEQICKATGSYPYVDNLGRIAIKAPRPPAAGVSPVYTFTPDNMLSLPVVKRDPIVNQVVIDYDAGEQNGGSSGSSGYGSTFADDQATSLSLYGFGQTQWTLRSDGIRTRWGARPFVDGVAARIFDRFAGVRAGATSLRGGACRYSVESMLMTAPVWTGDYVYLTHPQIWNMQTGALGVTDQVLEVVNRKPDYAQGKMSFELLDTGLTGLQVATAIGSGCIIGTAKLY